MLDDLRVSLIGRRVKHRNIVFIISVSWDIFWFLKENERLRIWMDSYIGYCSIR